MPDLPYSRDVVIVDLLSSPSHIYEGRPAEGPTQTLERVPVERIELRAGLGVVGDRYFGHSAHRAASVTLQSADALDALATELGLANAPRLYETRRNILISGVDIDSMVGAEFELDSGEGPVRFRAHSRANPCAWMDVTIAPGSHKGLRRRGGVRGEPLTDGVLRVGPATLRSSVPLADPPAHARATVLFEGDGWAV
jgi:MOSC domain-containing protein YiiM